LDYDKKCMLKDPERFGDAPVRRRRCKKEKKWNMGRKLHSDNKNVYNFNFYGKKSSPTLNFAGEKKGDKWGKKANKMGKKGYKWGK